MGRLYPLRKPVKQVFQSMMEGRTGQPASKTGGAPSTDYESDKRLVQACAEASPNAWEAFIERYGRLIRAVVRRVGPGHGCGPCDLEDFVSHVYEKLLEDRCRRLRAWRGACKLSTFVALVAKNLCRDYATRQGRDARTVSIDDAHSLERDESSPEEEEWRQHRRALLERAMAALPARRSLIMRLRLEGCTLRRIAELLDIPRGTVASENSRALEQLRVALNELEHDGRDAREMP